MKTILSIAIISVVLMVSAQAQNHEVIATSGDSYNNGTYTLNWTLGEVVSETVENGTITLTQGFQQPLLIITSIEDISNSGIKVSAYPNPTLNILYLELDGENFADFTAELLSLDGKMILCKDIANKIEELDLTGYAAAQYILIIKNNDGAPVKSIKLMKY